MSEPWTFVAPVHIDGAWRYSTLEIDGDGLHVFPEFAVPQRRWSSVFEASFVLALGLAWLAAGAPIAGSLSTYDVGAVGPSALIVAPFLLAGALGALYRERRSEEQALTELRRGDPGELEHRLRGNAQARSFRFDELEVVRARRWVVVRSHLGDRIKVRGLDRETRRQLVAALQNGADPEAADAEEAVVALEAVEAPTPSREPATPTSAPRPAPRAVAEAPGPRRR